MDLNNWNFEGRKERAKISIVGSDYGGRMGLRGLELSLHFFIMGFLVGLGILKVDRDPVNQLDCTGISLLFGESIDPIPPKQLNLKSQKPNKSNAIQ